MIESFTSFALGFCCCAVGVLLGRWTNSRNLHARMVQEFEADLPWGKILDYALKRGTLRKEHGHIKVVKTEGES